MNALKRLVPGSVLGFSLLAFSAPADTPAFGPEKGSGITKTFDTHWEYDLDDLSIVIDGQDISSMIGNIEFSTVVGQTVTVDDTYGSTVGGRPAKLTRLYDSLESLTTVSMASEFGDQDQQITGSSELEGETVVFTWDEEEGEYRTAFEGEEGDEDLLEGLREDMDLRVFLPRSEVSEGETWEVDLESLEILIMPGGNLAILPEGAEQEDSEFFQSLWGEDFAGELSDLLDGTCTCTYKGTRKSDEVTLGEIHVAIEVDASADLSEALMDILEALSDEFGGETPDLTVDVADVTVDISAEGVLLWNMSAGRVHSLEIAGNGDVVVDLSIAGEMEGESGSADISAELSGSMELTVTTE